MLVKDQHYKHFEPHWNSVHNHQMENGFLLKSNLQPRMQECVQISSNSSISNEYKYDDLKKTGFYTEPTQKFTVFTIDHILAPKIENELNRRSSLNTLMNPIRPIPMQATLHPSFQLPRLNNVSANNFNSSGLLVGDYQKFHSECKYSGVQHQMNVNNVRAPIPYQLMADSAPVNRKTQPKRNRRRRTVFTPKQLRLLKAAFDKTHYPDICLRQKLAENMSLKEEHVHVWFKNRRAKVHKSQTDGTTSKIIEIQTHHSKRKSSRSSSSHIQNISIGHSHFSSYRDVDDSLSSSSSSSD